jgi:hypothetical protein
MNLVTNLLLVGSVDEALATADEAIGRYEELATREPTRYQPELARALGVVGDIYVQRSNKSASVAALTKSIAVWNTCAKRDPGLYTVRHQRARRRLGQVLTVFGDDPEAILLG